MKRYRKKQHVDIHAARELELYTENDYDLYRQRTTPTIKNLARKKFKGIYNPKLAVKAFQNVTDVAAKKYIKEMGTGGGFGIFRPIERKYAAARLAKSFESEFKLGNYNQFKQKYLKKKRKRR